MQFPLQSTWYFELVIFLAGYIYMVFPTLDFLSLPLESKYEGQIKLDDQMELFCFFNLTGKVDANLKLRHISNSVP